MPEVNSNSLECGGLTPLSKKKSPTATDWPHAPPHRLAHPGTYMVTCATYQKKHWLNKPSRLDYLQSQLLNIMKELGWELHAWAILSNHYHFIASTKDSAETMRKLVSKCHTLSAIQFNREDHTPERKIWHQYYESRITFQTSYMARLHYVHFNPARHGLVTDASNYPWCSAAWFESNVRPAFYKTIKNMKTDRLSILDAYQPAMPVT